MPEQIGMPEQMEYDSSEEGSMDSFNGSVITDYSFSDDHVSLNCDDLDSDVEEDALIGVNISHSLILWALNYGISHTALTALLLILRHFGQEELPKHAKSLLSTPRTRISVRPCPPGEAFYYGIQNSLVDMDNSIFDNMTEVVTDFFIDGMSVSKSSTREIWPVMGSFVGRMDLNPHLVHAYAGPGKPKNVDDFLLEFTEEITKLRENGVLCGKSRNLKNFIIRAFICDSPAAAFVTGRIGHSSYHGCPKCDQVCTRDEVNNRLVYQTSAGIPRTDESFLYRDDPSHHRPEFLDRHSLLEQAGIGHVSQFVIDPLHLIDIGVTKKITLAIFDNLLTMDFGYMNDRFLSYRPFVPSELERKPRTLSQLKKFKGNEFKQLLSYTLPVLLKDCVQPHVYQQVLLLHVGVRLLQDPQNYMDNLNAARTLINMFVEEYPDILGIQNFTFNTHCLLHTSEVVEEYGALYSFSGYRHENHLRLLNRLLRKQDLHLQQFYNRFAEISIANDIEYVTMDKSFQYNSYILRANNLRDGCCMVKPGIPVVITDLIESNGTKIIRGRRYLQCENFFDYPVASMESQGIILASLLSANEEDFPSQDVLYKYYRLPYHNLCSLMDHLITKKWILPKHPPPQPKPSTVTPITILPKQISEKSVRHASPIPNSQTSTPKAIRTYSRVLPVLSAPSSSHLLSSSISSSSKPLNPFSNDSIAIDLQTSCEPSTSASYPTSQTLAPVSYSDCTSKAEYRNVNINGKIVAMKLVKVPHVQKKADPTGGQRQSSNYTDSNQKDFRATSTHELNSFTAKRAMFRVLPKANDSTGESSGDHQWGTVALSSAVEIPESRDHRFVDDAFESPNEMESIGEAVESSTAKPDNERNPNTTDEFDIREEIRAIRKSQQETLDLVQRFTEREETHRRALEFPVDTKDGIEKLETLIRGKGFRKKLFETLVKRVSRTKKDEVVSELISFIFTPNALNNYNVSGIQVKNAKGKRSAFTNLRINQVIKEIAKMDTVLYDLHLTKAIHMMHARFARMEAVNALRAINDPVSDN